MNLMNWKLPAVAGGLLLLGALVLAGYLKWDNAALRRENTAQAETIATLSQANAAQKTAIDALRNDADENAALLVAAAREKDELRARSRHLERRAREAVNHVQTVTVADPWPVAVRNALCLRWLAAENRLPADYHGTDAALADGIETDPVARFCAAWNTLTPEETLTWLGALLDHIGELSIDRDAVRKKGRGAP